MNLIPPPSERRAGFLSSISVGPAKRGWLKSDECCGCGAKDQAHMAYVGDPWKIEWHICLACARKIVEKLESLGATP